MLSSARGLGLPRGLVVRRFVVLFIAVLAFVLAPWPATAAPPDNFPDQIDLPDGFFPEGIESGRGTSVFVGSLIDGAIWRGDLRTGSGAVLADPAIRARAGVGRHRLRGRAGTGCGLRVADPDSTWVPVMCGSTTRPAATCSRPSSRLGTSGSSTTWRSHMTRCT